MKNSNNNLIEINSYSSHKKILVEGVLKRLESFNCDFVTLIQIKEKLYN